MRLSTSRATEEEVITVVEVGVGAITAPARTEENFVEVLTETTFVELGTEENIFVEVGTK